MNAIGTWARLYVSEEPTLEAHGYKRAPGLMQALQASDLQVS